MSQLNASLDQWLARLAPTIDAEHYVFARADEEQLGDEAFRAILTECFAIVRERPRDLRERPRDLPRPAALTLVVSAHAAQAAELVPLLHCRRIDPGVDTPLDGVGFLAAIARVLAAEGIALNPIAGAARDHLFVATADAARAKTALEALAREARSRLESSSEIEAILAFWFGQPVDGFADAATRRRWFNSTPEIDAEIARRFGPLLERASAGGLAAWLTTARGALAYILVTDQFSRQVHRGTARAFATDPLARAAARTAVANRFDLDLPFDARAFVYMPFMHSESIEDQRTSLRLFAALSDATQRDDRFASSLDAAREHHDLIERFGRFPHRNAALDRASTEAEIAHLRHASGFGQSAS